MKHQFAIFYENPIPHVAQRFVLDNEDLVHRVKRVLRLHTGDVIILFNENSRACVQLSFEGHVFGVVLERVTHDVVTPHITAYIPVLKQQDLEQAVLMSVSYGVNEVQLITTSKTHKLTLSLHEKKRLERISIGACEEAKWYTKVYIKDPIPLATALKNIASLDAVKVVCFVSGNSISRLTLDNTQKRIICLVGPEGDFTQEEYQEIHNAGFVGYKLTPTVLHSWQAVSLMIGFLRSQ